MKLVIAGCRHFKSKAYYYMLQQVLDDLLINDKLEDITEVVQGGAAGIDFHAKEWSWDVGVKCTEFRADWDTLGKAAGPTRNLKMADYGDALLAIWDGESRGTKDMINKMRSAGKPVFVLNISLNSIV